MKLKDCPFCGSQAFPTGIVGAHLHGVKCRGCFVKIPCEYPSPEQAAGAWNRRWCEAPRIALPVFGEVK